MSCAAYVIVVRPATICSVDWRSSSHMTFTIIKWWTSQGSGKGDGEVMEMLNG